MLSKRDEMSSLTLLEKTDTVAQELTVQTHHQNKMENRQRSLPLWREHLLALFLLWSLLFSPSVSPTSTAHNPPTDVDKRKR